MNNSPDAPGWRLPLTGLKMMKESGTKVSSRDKTSRSSSPHLKPNRLIQKDGLDNTLLSCQQLWTPTFLEIVLLRKQFPSFIKPDTSGMKTPWRILVDKECFRLETHIKRAVELGTLERSEEEIDFRLSNAQEPLVETIEDSKHTGQMDYYFLLSHKEPSYRPIDLIILLLEQGYPVPSGLIYSLKEKRFQEAGKFLWVLHQNVIHWLCNKINSRSTKLPYPIEKVSGGKKADQFISKRDAGKLKTQERNALWHETYLRLMKENPKWNGTRCALEISKMEIGDSKNPETIRRIMKIQPT